MIAQIFSQESILSYNATWHKFVMLLSQNVHFIGILVKGALMSPWGVQPGKRYSIILSDQTRSDNYSRYILSNNTIWRKFFFDSFAPESPLLLAYRWEVRYYRFWGIQPRKRFGFLSNQTRTYLAITPNTCFPNMPNDVKFVTHLPLGLRYRWHFSEMRVTTASEESNRVKDNIFLSNQTRTYVTVTLHGCATVWLGLNPWRPHTVTIGCSDNEPAWPPVPNVTRCRWPPQ